MSFAHSLFPSFSLLPITLFSFFFLMTRRPLCSTLFPYTTLFRSDPEFWIRQGPLVTPRLHVAFTAPSREAVDAYRSEEHTSELQSQSNLVCRLLLEKKNKKSTTLQTIHSYRTNTLLFTISH